MTLSAPPTLFIFTALECEARALIMALSLKKNNAKHPFSIYRHADIVLTVTGIGRVAMAGGVAYTLALFPLAQSPVMLNIGIAGHKSKALGTLLTATKIIDNSSNKAFYPQFLSNHWTESCELKTVSKPDTRYTFDGLVDMEASAFYEMAVKFSTCELIHCLKIVSDNNHTSIDRINPKRVSEWVASQMDSIQQIMDDLKTLNQPIQTNGLRSFDEIIKKWHFTVTGTIKLKALLNRWQLLSTDCWLSYHSHSFSDGKQLLKKLQSDVENLDVYL